MLTLWPVLAIGFVPLLLGMATLAPAPPPPLISRATAFAILLNALAFNLTFFWQELWLVIPKALTPGLHPILYHNDHDWRGDAAIAELLQGSGAAATLVSGLFFLCLLGRMRCASSAWRAFVFWMAVQGLFQSLSQLAIGAILPGNDVGRSLVFLHAGAAAKIGLFALAVVAMALAGWRLVRACPLPAQRRGFAIALVVVMTLSLLPIVPFRLPRNMIEVLFIPAIVHLLAAGWLIAGAAIGRGAGMAEAPEPALAVPAMALLCLLLFFQLVLRPGIAF